MSYDILNTQEIKSSRKDYPCDISIVIREEIEYNEDFLRQITEDEYNEIMKAKSDGWKILKGSPYRKRFATIRTLNMYVIAYRCC